MAGGVAAVLAVVPPTTAVIGDHLPAPDVVAPVLLIATVPLIVVGALIEVVRLAPSGWERASHRFLEWVLLAAGIVAIYTGLVAGLGRLVGGSGPTWFLVAATGAIALLVEPGRQRVRKLVDHLVYGSRDETLTLVRQVMGHVSTVDEEEDLLPALASSLGREMRLDAVAIDVAGPNGWERAATYGSAAPPRANAGHRRELLLRHHDEVVGRLLVGWADAPSLRPRDEATLEELAAPLALGRELGPPGRRPAAIEPGRAVGPRGGAAPDPPRPARRPRPAADGHLARLAHRHPPAQPGRRGRHAAARCSGAWPTRWTRPSRRSSASCATCGRPRWTSSASSARWPSSPTGSTTRSSSTSSSPGPTSRCPAAVEVAVYRIVTEALTNVVRHAEAARCWLRIEARDVVEIEVVDDGVGLPPGPPVGVGLAAMRERAAELGGTVTVGPRSPHGTRLHVLLPAALPMSEHGERMARAAESGDR